jgi:hypothetical protein
MSKDTREALILIAAIAVAVWVIAKPVGDGLAVALPALGEMGRLIIAGVGAGVGASALVAGGGAAVLGPLAPILGPAAGAALTLGGASVAILVLRKVIVEGDTDRYTALAPVIAVAAGVATDISLQAAEVTDTSSTMIGALVSTLLIGGGIVIRWGGRAYTLLGGALLAVAPVVLVGTAFASQAARDPIATIRSIDPLTWALAGLLVVALLLVGWLALHPKVEPFRRA